MEELTLDALKAMEPGMFAKGEGMCKKWVAVRGGIHDWAIYCGPMENSYELIERSGDKLYGDEAIRQLVPCTDEALAWYRL
jgi:hypothetical protein